MKHTFFKLSCLAASAAMLFGSVSCNKTEIVEKEVAKAAIEFVNAGDKNVVLPFNSVEPVTIAIKNNFKVADLMIEAKAGGDWCTAAFEGEDKIVITPNETGIGEDKTATFTVKAAPASKATPIEEHIIYVPEAVEFTVSREKTEFQDKPVITLTEAPEGNAYVMEAFAQSLAIKMTANFDIDQLNITGKALPEGADWCEAIITDANTITINVLETADPLADAEAAFTVVYTAPETKGVVEVPAQVEFKVSRPAGEPEILGFEGEGITAKEEWGMIFYDLNVPGEGGSYEITVNTNGCMWYANTSMMTLPAYWSVDPLKGNNGSKVTLFVPGNGSGSKIDYTLMVVTEEGGYMGQSLSIHQAVMGGGAEASSVVVKFKGTEQENGFEMPLPAKGGSANKVSFEIIPTGGEVEYKFVETGTSTVVSEENQIGFAGKDMNTDNGWYINPKLNNTGAERRQDLIIVPMGGNTELFRIHLVQAAN